MPLISDVKKHIGHIVLNRPNKLNAMSKEMVYLLSDCFKAYEENPAVKVILIEGMGSRAFSAGGDIIEMYHDIFTADTWSDQPQLFDIEYGLVEKLYTLKTPYVALWQGVVMGGGVGLGMPADIIFADDTVQWAMPETRLGFCPDVGMGYFLSQLPQPVAMYITLSGSTLSGADLVKYGLATYYIEHRHLPFVRSEILAVRKKNTAEETLKELRMIAGYYAKPVETCPLDQEMDAINHYYGAPTLKEIFKRLEAGTDAFAKHHLSVLRQRCPLALAVQFEKYFVGKNLTLPQTLMLDNHIIRDGIARGNVQEGIRVAMLDKQATPKWSPPSLDDVTPETVKAILTLS